MTPVSSVLRRGAALPTSSPRRHSRPNLARMAVALSASLVFTWTAVLAQAVVRTLPVPAPHPVDPTALMAASPQAPGPVNPQREKMLQTLRTAAQSDMSPPRGTRRATGGDVPPADAAWLLGLLALHGVAMPADPPQARQWFDRAQMLGNPLAPAGLAWCQITGCVTSPNPSSALHWIALLRRTDAGLSKLLEWHAAKALAPLGDPTTPGRSGEPSQPASPLPLQYPAHRLLAEAARAGNATAANELGLEYLAAGDVDQALIQFSAAAPRSQAAAHNAASLSSRAKGNSGARQRSARYSGSDWYQEARRYHRGEGVPANYTEAVRLYQIAASSGDTQARKMLELIFSRPTQAGAIDIAWMQQLAGVEINTRGRPEVITASTAHQGWQRDPSPLYALLPAEWRAPASAPPR